MPSASAITTTPTPPITFITQRHATIDSAMWSKSMHTDRPVVVKHETVSKRASR